MVLIPILFGIVAVTSVLLFTTFDNESTEPQPKSIYGVGFTYYDVEKIKTTLEKQDISMSLPTAITDHTIGQYCTFFDDDEKVQRSVEYCTTTALLDSDGKSFGNINMGGTVDSPILALALIDVSPFLDSKKDEVSSVFQTMIETLICDCWEEKQPGGFESVDMWLETAEKKYAESSQTAPLKSKIDGLDRKKLILEIKSMGESSYRWTLIILK